MFLSLVVFVLFFRQFFDSFHKPCLYCFIFYTHKKNQIWTVFDFQYKNFVYITSKTLFINLYLLGPFSCCKIIINLVLVLEYPL